MKMHTLSIILLATAVIPSLAVEHLTDRYRVESHSVHIKSKAESTPVIFKLDSVDGTVWRFAGNSFVQIPVEKTLTASSLQEQETSVESARQRELLDKMNQIRIPEINFRQADIRDVITFLQRMSVDHSPDNTGFSMILALGHESRPQQTSDSDATDFFGAPSTDTPQPANITFSALDISLREALDVVTDVADLRWRISGGAIMIIPYTLSRERATRMYEILPSTIERIHTFHPELVEPDITTEDLADRWKAFFQEHWIDWPLGSHIQPIPMLGRILVNNTIENLEIFESVLNAINTYPSQSGRFCLINNHLDNQQFLILLDTEVGHTWRYHISEYDSETDTIKIDSFTYIIQKDTQQQPAPYFK